MTTRIWIWLMPVLAATAVYGCATRAPWPHAAGQHAVRFERSVRETVAGRMLLYLPRNFRSDSGKKYPLLVFLHGSGEIGVDIELIKKHGPPQWLETRTDFPFIVASPQSPLPEVRGFDPHMLDAMLDELLERLPIDRDRVYLTGLSLGGIWSYGWAALRPERFAAIVPMSGRWDTEDACRLKDVPVWAFHGELDDAVPLAGDSAMVDAVNRCGGQAKLTVFPGEGHEIWEHAYADPALYAWLLAQRRAKR
ncbi:MAG: prolyl oligopeptidase family serine peptidase [Pseudomonadota bacterium]